MGNLTPGRPPFRYPVDHQTVVTISTISRSRLGTRLQEANPVIIAPQIVFLVPVVNAGRQC